MPMFSVFVPQSVSGLSTIGLDENDDQKRIIYDYAVGSFILQQLPIWTPLNDTAPRFWIDCNDSSKYVVNGSNYLDSITNKILSYPEHNVTTGDRRTNGNILATVNGYSCFKMIKSSASYINVPLGVHTLDPTSFTYTVAFAIDSTQTNLFPVIFTVPYPDGEDIQLFIKTTSDEIVYIQNTLSKYMHYPLTMDIIHIISVSYDGTTTRIYINGQLIGTLNVSSSGIGVSAMLIGSADIFGTWPTYDLGGYILDFAMSDNHDHYTRQKYEGYLYHKYGKQQALVSTHPYLNNPPMAI
jgi:hypothetical protein